MSVINHYSEAELLAYDIGPDEEGMLASSNDSYQEKMECEAASRPSERINEPLDESVQSVNLQEFYSELKRLQTFENHWYSNYHVSSQDLARDGFIYEGPVDRVKCVFCLKHLWSWMPGDVVQDEHKRHYPNCPWVKGQCSTLNIPITSAAIMQASFGLRMKTEPESSFVSLPMKQRQETYPQNWAEICLIPADALAEAGFVYTGNNDKVQCFVCGKFVRQWENGDEPWVEHARWSPGCEYVLSMKGPAFVEKVQKERNGQAKTEWNNSNRQFTPDSQEFSQMVPSRPSDPKVHYPVQVSSAQLEADMRSTAVTSYLEIFDDTPMEELIKRLEAIRIKKGPDYKITAKDLTPTEK